MKEQKINVISLTGDEMRRKLAESYDMRRKWRSAREYKEVEKTRARVRRHRCIYIHVATFDGLGAATRSPSMKSIVVVVVVDEESLSWSFASRRTLVGLLTFLIGLRTPSRFPESNPSDEEGKSRGRVRLVWRRLAPRATGPTLNATESR